MLKPFTQKNVKIRVLPNQSTRLNEMKNYSLFGVIAVFFSFCGITLNSCSSKLSEEDEVRTFAGNFIDHARVHNYDSLVVMYENIVMADSIVPVKNENLKITKVADGQYQVILGDGIIMNVARNENGNLIVKESKGLFAFHPIHLDIAKKTGLWNDTLSDIALAERMDDQAFFSYVALRAKPNYSDLVEVEKSKGNKSAYTLTNKSGVHIRGNEYEIVKRYGNPDREEEISNETFPGEDIPPHESIVVPSTKPKNVSMEVVNVRFILSDDDFNKKFATYSGNEYQEYLDSKSLLTDKPDSIPHINRTKQLLPPEALGKKNVNNKK